MERLHREIRRRTRVVGIFPHEASALRLISAVLAEIHEEWLTGRQYLNLAGWVNPPQGWKVDQRYLTVQNPPQTVSQEIRKVEFELKRSPGVTGSVMIPAYALYYVCENVDGICLYRRHDIPIQLDVE